ncbi:hypothetical protein [Cyanobium sp. Morenito 9A2]|nr:hypothetical protein [Cyanobium sp. Morenito 9A2]
MPPLKSLVDDRLLFVEGMEATDDPILKPRPGVHALSIARRPIGR